MSHFDPIRDLVADLEMLTKSAQAAVLVEDVKRLREGEVRPAAVLYLDIVGFTALSRILSTEMLATLVDRVFRLFHLDAERYGGYCDDVAGDAALYVFLGDADHPPASEGALRAGLAIIERAASLNESLSAQGISLGVRVGVNHGEVTRQAVGGELTVIGDTVNLAQRLESVAAPGTVRAGAEVHEATAGKF